MNFCRYHVHVKYVLNILLFFLLSSGIYAQDNNIGRNYLPPSPQAVSLGNYAVIPVDYYTGIPDIKIPLYDIKIRGFELNLNLSYHSGGIKQNEEASNVGLGWALNAGGVITRTIRHKDDLGANGYYKSNPATRPCDDNNDQEPDLFYYNFAGRTGKFIIDYFSSGVNIIRQLNKTEMFIYLDPSNNFKIMDEKGNSYFFEQKENNNSVCSSNVLNFNENATSSWYLTKITTVLGENILFSYTVTGNRFQNKVTNTSTRSYGGAYPYDLFSSYYTVGGMAGNAYYTYAIAPFSYSTYSRDTYSYTDEIILSSITFTNGAIKIYSSTRSDLRMQGTVLGKKIDRIEVLKNSISGPILKAYTLSYDYYNSGSGQPSNIATRLRLISVQETNLTQSVPAYTFEYSSATLPDKGYGGGPEDFLGNPILGLMVKVNYPTSGYSSFTYEPHFGNLGARIKNSVQYDSKGLVNKRQYEYGGGKVLGRYWPFSGYTETSNLQYYVGWPGSPGQTGPFSGAIFWNHVFTSSSANLGESSSTYQVGYDTVREYFGDNSTGGKVEITYNNIANATTAFGVPADVSTLNGRPLIKTEYSYISGTYYPVQKTTYSYSKYEHNTVNPKRLFLGGCSLNYIVSCDWLALANEEEYYYDAAGQNPLRNYRSYTYAGSPFHLQPTRIIETDPKGNTLQTDNKYAYEETSLGAVYSQMGSKNLYSTLIEQTKSVNGVVVRKTTTTYKDWFANQTIITPEIIQKQKGTFAVENELTFRKYDNFGNPLEFVKTDGIITSNIWDYNNTYVVAQCVNAKSTDIAYTSFEADGLGGWTMNPGSQIIYPTELPGRKSFSGVLLKSGLAAGTYVVSLWGYRYGTQTVNGAAGTVLYYRGNWSLKSWEVTNPGTISVACDNCDEVRLYPKGAQMTTWTYEPLVGVTSQIDPRNRITSYEYDGLNRLVVIRDADKNIVKKICYNYSGQAGGCTLTYNLLSMYTATRNNCGGQIPSTVQYTIPAGTYVSSMDQTDANYQTNKDGNANAQNYANTYGTCTPGIVIYGTNSKSQNYNLRFTNNATGTVYYFILTANTYSSVTLGAVPSGVYAVLFYPQGSPITCTFNINGSTYTGSGASFTNISVTATSTASMY
jgi:YD repeat-containing protein